MSSYKSHNPTATVAFFGATGDCAGFALANALKAGYKCSALARTPDKLKSSLEAKGVATEALSNLTIVQGDARDEKAVTKALCVDDGEMADVIVSAVGSFPIMQWSFTSPVVIKDQTVCEDAANVLVRSINQLNTPKKPLVVAISTTGIQPAGKPRDVPLAYYGLYHWLLKSPHDDKRKMESIFRTAYNLPAASRRMSGFVAVKPTLLMDGKPGDLNSIRCGTEDDPAIGYTIKRAEVGSWIFHKLIAETPPQDWMGKGVCLTA